MIRTKIYLLFVLLIVTAWSLYVWQNEYSVVNIYALAWPMACTMVIGAFIAGASSEGGGAIAFPVMTLLLAIAPADARIFSLGIQSFGMTAASLLIIGQRIPVIYSCIVPVSLGGMIGFSLGDLYLVPIVSPPLTKLFFVSLWLGFGFALFLIQRTQPARSEVSLHNPVLFLLFGVAGGSISALFGNGIDILTFTLLTLFFRVDVKIATPTSVLLMTVMTIYGFLWHLLVKEDVSPLVEVFLLGCIPVVIFMAPLGAFTISKLKSRFIEYFLYTVIVVQFITAMVVIRPNINGILFCTAVIMGGSFLFFLLGKSGKKA